MRSAALLVLLAAAPAAADPVLFRAEVPRCTPPGDTVLLRSNRMEPTTFTHDPMLRAGPARWEVAVEVLTPPEAFEYKYTHAPCDAVACTGIEKDIAYGGSGDELTPRRLAAGQGETQDRVFVWRDMWRTFDAAGQPLGYRATEELAAFCGPYLGVHDPEGRLGLGHDTFAPGAVSVEWGADPTYGRSASLADGHRHQLVLDPLPPGAAEVHYRVVVDGAPGPDLRFPAPPGPDGELRFVHLGDTQHQDASTSERVRSLVSRALAFRPHLVVGTGDLVQSTGVPPEIGRWSVLFGDLAELLAVAPFVTAMGNHEEDGAYFWDVLQRPLTDAPRLDHFDFRLGNTQFFVLYTGTTSGYDLEGILDSQTPWLEARLAAAAADPRVRWKVVALHRGPESQSAVHVGEGALFADGGTATRPSWRSLWELHGVDLVLAGHTHVLTVAAVEGIRYVTECGGVGTYPLLEPWAASTQYAESVCSLGQLTAGPRLLSFRAHRPDGSEVVPARFDLCREDADCAELADPCPAPQTARWTCQDRACQATCIDPEDGGQDGAGDGWEDGQGEQDQDSFEGEDGGQDGGQAAEGDDTGSDVGGCGCGHRPRDLGEGFVWLALLLACLAASRSHPR